MAPFRAACTPLALLDALVPKDAGSTLAVRDLAYGAHPRQRLDIYLPAAAAETAPLLMFLPGGSWRAGRKEHYRFVGRAFAAHGFVTAIPDHRLVPEVRFPDFVVDCGRALKVFRSAAKGHVDKIGPLFLVGHSSGAYNAVMLALDDGLAKAAGCARNTIAGVVGISGLYDFLPLRLPAAIEAFAGIEDLAATQPINLASATAPPMLLLAGAADTSVQPRNAERLARALGDAGSHADFSAYPGLGHAGTLVGLARPFRRRADILGDITRFLWPLAGIEAALPSSAKAPWRLRKHGVFTSLPIG